MAIVAVLIGLLLPLLLHARTTSQTVACASNLRQLAAGWHGWFQVNERFPQHTDQPDWRYGGATFVGVDRTPVLDGERPVNKFLADRESDTLRLASLFRCPSDIGVYQRGLGPKQPKISVLPFNRSCFAYFGTSYRANPSLMNSTIAGLDNLGRPLSLSDIQSSPSSLLLLGDATWYYSTRTAGSPDNNLDASWHSAQDSGNMLALDGSTRFMRYQTAPSEYTLAPRPGPR